MGKWGFPGRSAGKESTCNAGDPGLTAGSGRSPGERIGYPLQYSCWRIPMDRGPWQATVHGVAKRHDWTAKNSTAQWVNTPFYTISIYTKLIFSSFYALCPLLLSSSSSFWINPYINICAYIYGLYIYIYIHIYISAHIHMHNKENIVCIYLSTGN